MEGDTGIPVNPGMLEVVFDENLNPATINTNTVQLKRGSTVVNSKVEYRPKDNRIEIFPNSVLATNVDYSIYITGGSSGIGDLAGNKMTATTTTITFTTNSEGDTTPPQIEGGNATNYKIFLDFTEPLKQGLVTDQANWSASMLNPNNFSIKYGIPSTNWSSAGTVIDLNTVNFRDENGGRTLVIEGIDLDWNTVQGMDYYIDMSASFATDLSGNLVASSSMNTMQMPINDDAMQNDGMMDFGMMGMMMAGAFPMNGMAGQQTIYFIDIPTSKSIPAGGKINIKFPVGFDVSNAIKDPWSPINNDINEWNDGVVTISSVYIATATPQTISIITGGDATQASDYLHMDISGIGNKNSEGEYYVTITTFDDNGVLLETLKTDDYGNNDIMPFYINSGGNSSLVVSVAGIQASDVDGVSDQVDVYLDSPITGPMEGVINIANDGTGSTTFSNIPEGEYMVFTEPLITLDSSDYSGNPMPEPIWIGSGINNKTVTLSKEGAGVGKATISINITGELGTDDIDIFAGSPNGFKVKTLVDAGTNPSAQLFLPDGDWMVGMGPAMPKGPMSGPPPMPDWMPPMNVYVKVSNNGLAVNEDSANPNDGTIALTVNTASKQIKGYVKDGSGNPISNAEVYAYQSMGNGMGSNTKTDTNGVFTLKIAENGNYKVGAFKPGLPYVPERSIVVKNDSGNVGTDGNLTADVYRDGGSIITIASPFEIKIKKPSYTISGSVKDASANPVPWSPVWADRADGTGHADTMTDSSGNFIIYVDNGTWNLNAYIPGVGDAETEQVVVSDNNESGVTLDPAQGVTYVNITGKVGKDTDGDFSTLEDPFEYMPIRAVEYDANGVYQGREYGSMTDSSGNYTISVPQGIYRVDIWTQEFGEMGINNINETGNNVLKEVSDDDYANNPANVNATGGNAQNYDIIVSNANLRTINLVFANAQAGQEGFLHIEGVNYDGGDGSSIQNGFHFSTRIDDLSNTNTIQLNDGDFLFFLDVPGIGSFIPDDSSNPDGRDATKDLIEVSSNRNVDFTLTDLASGAITVAGTVYDTEESGGNELGDAWVWVGNPDTGYHNGTQANSSGAYSLLVPIGSYFMGADKPGFISGEPINFDASTSTTQNFVLTPYDLTISGRLYTDANSNNQYDAGEEVPNGFVRAETTDYSQKSHSPVDGTGYFEIGVVAGEWNIYGMADGYAETSYSTSITITTTSASNKNIKLTTNSNWEQKSKKKPMTPASGGTMDDTAQDNDGKSSGTGVKLTVPPNALGNSSASGNVNANKTSAVTKTNSFDPIGDSGVNITATDNSGQAITNLNDYVDVEMVLYKADVDEGISNDEMSYTKLKTTKNAYWDSTINDWVSLTTSRNAYYKLTGDTEWKLYNNTSATSSFEAFINTLIAGTPNYIDYKLVYTSKVNHFTIFGIVNPTDLSAPSAPSGLTSSASNGSVVLNWNDNSESDLLEYQVFRGNSASFTCNDASQINSSSVTTSGYTDSTPSNDATYEYYYRVTAVDDSGNVSSCSSAVSASYTYTAPVAPSGGGGGGGGGSSLCSSVEYDEWQVCVDGVQYRNVKSKSPYGCRLTTAQQNDASRECTEAEVAETIEEETSELEIEPIMVKQPRVITMKEIDVVYLDQGGFVNRGDVNEILQVMNQERNHENELAARQLLTEKMAVKMEMLEAQIQYALTNFIAYGSPDTAKLGSGERAGVVNSFRSAFGKLPENDAEWSDVIKIANGRWPSELSTTSEAMAVDVFIKIYKRIPDRTNPNDDAAITVIAYGLRPANRNTESEASAIKIFKAIYDYHPNSATDWDIVRAIAYSGAVRQPDSDGDLIPDERELIIGTDPNNSDTDGDGFNDGEEILADHDPLN